MPAAPREPAGLAALLETAAGRLRGAAGLAPAEARRLARELWRLASGQAAGSALAGTAPAPVAAGPRARFEALLSRAEHGEPLAYLEGTAGFYGLEFEVDRAVLVPRCDSECLVEVALERIPAAAGARVVDLGTGSGCLLLALLAARAGLHGVGVDASAAALAVARRNAGRLGLAARARFVRADWLEPFGPATADWLVANPPYVVPGEELGHGVAEHEPATALFTPPDDPLASYRRILARAPAVLRPGGYLLFEAGAGRAAAVEAEGVRAGLAAVTRRRDLGGIERAILLRRPA